MPHFYAHRVFGELVWNQLPQHIRDKLTPQKSGFRLGLYGPDPLFFYQSWKRSPVYREGLAQHRQGPQAVLERYRGHTAEPQALGYTMGWLCHYMLDAACHPIIRSACAGKSVGHAAIELALDRRLIKKHPLPKEDAFPPEVFFAAALGCKHTSADQFRQALKGFYRFSYSTAALYRGGGDAALCAKLMVQLHQAVPECVRLAAKLVDCLEHGKALDWLPQTDFNGLRCNPTESVVK